MTSAPSEPPNRANRSTAAPLNGIDLSSVIAYEGAIPGVEQRDFLARLARQASAEPSLPDTWRRDGGWLLAPAGAPRLWLGFAVRRHDAGIYVHMARDA